MVQDMRSLADSLQAVVDAVADNGAAEAELTTTKESEKAGKTGKAVVKFMAEGIEQQQTMILKQQELMEDIKNAIDELIKGIQYEDEYYTKILNKMVVGDKSHIDVYLEMFRLFRIPINKSI